MRRVISTCLLAIAAAGVHAGEPWTWDGSLSLAAGYMDYRETDSSGRQLNRERGALPGIAGALLGQSGVWSAGADLVYFAGDVEYEGMTNTNLALTTRTDQRIADAKAWLGLRGFENTTTAMDFYLGAGLRWWNRDIRSTGSAFGVDETYTWPYLLAGLRTERRLRDGDSVVLNLRLLRPVEPDLQVDFKNAYDSVDVDPKPRAGGRLGLSWIRPWSGGRTLAVSLWYEHWRFDASDSELLRLNSVPVGTVHEPESRTEFVGLAISVGGLGL